MTDQNYLITVPWEIVAANPEDYPPSMQRQCHRCGRAVAVALSGLVIIKKEQALPICMGCVQADEANEIEPPTEMQLIEWTVYCGRRPLPDEKTIHQFLLH